MRPGRGRARRSAGRPSSLPCVISMSARVMAQPRTSATCPARERLSVAARYAACAASRSPCPGRDARGAPMRRPTSDVVAGNGAVQRELGVLPPCRAGRHRPARARRGRSRPQLAGAQLRGVGHDLVRRPDRPRCCSTSGSRCVETVELDCSAARAPMNPTASTGRFRTMSAGSSSTQRQMTASRRWRSMVGMASSTWSAARSMSPAASACRTAASGSSGWSYHSLARRCSSGTSAGPLIEQAGVEHVGEQVVVPIPACGDRRGG